MPRPVSLTLALLLAGLIAIGFYALSEARRDPLVRTATIKLPGWPASATPVRAVLISDIHMGSVAMDEARLERIVARINALKPDIVLIAGDMIFGADPNGAAKVGATLVTPLSHLRAPLGVVAVLGNHDQWTGPTTVRALLARANITVLENEAIVRGPLAIGGVGDFYTHHENLDATVRRMRTLVGARLLLTHSPDIAPTLPATTSLLLAGHTHCGQFILPFLGPVLKFTHYGARYRCGIRHEGHHAVIVTAGLGTSGPPLRLGAPPDLWLLTLGP